MSITTRDYGTTSKGDAVTLYEMTNNNGMKVSLIDFGAVITSIQVADKFGAMADVALGYDDLVSYEEKNGPGFGSFIGRHANRIGKAVFTLNGKEYKLQKNDNDNNLHGGAPGYNKLMYQATFESTSDGDAVTFTRTSPDGEQGFPGELKVSVTYTLTNDNELKLEYNAVSDKDTLVNLTNHSYFNLAGHNSGDVLGHEVVICAKEFTPTGDDLIPTGEYRDVTGTPMDFRVRKAIGLEIGADYEPLKQAGGYDHNFVLDKKTKGVEYVGEVFEPKSGRKMEIFTDLPGMQFYTGNFIFNEKGKQGAEYVKRHGVCFETQYFPNSCNTSNFQSCELKAGENYNAVTIYRFSVEG